MKITINQHFCNSLDDIKKNASKEFFAFVNEFYNDESFIRSYTSGSTGKPKEIKLSKADMLVSAKNTNDFFCLNSDSVFYLGLSPNYIAGKMMILRALILEAEIIEEEPSNEPLINYHGKLIDLAALVPSQMISLIRNPAPLQYVKNIIIGGGAISPNLRKHIIDLNLNAYSTFGMTETCSHVALALIDRCNSPYVLLADNSASINEDGALILDLPSYSTKHIETNDMVDLLDAKHFYWKGRKDNVINSGGIKIHPEEIEPKLAELIKNSRFFLSSLPSDKWGEELVLVLEYPSLPEGTKKEGPIRPAFIEEMKRVLPYYAIPRYYVAVKRFKVTSSGKLIREI